jgi:hypothetical protein
MPQGSTTVDWINAHDLENWSGTRDSQGTLPDLVRRLIRASIRDIRLMRFPSGDAVVMSGWDGILASSFCES